MAHIAGVSPVYAGADVLSTALMGKIEVVPVEKTLGKTNSILYDFYLK